MEQIRAVVAWLALVAVGGALASCGGSRGAVVGAASSSAPVTKGQAAAYAHAVNLLPADLPDMTIVASEREGKAPTPGDRELATCDGGPNPDRVISKIKSATFKGSVEGVQEEIKSSVEVEPTEALAAENRRVALSGRFLRCLGRLLPQTFAKADGGGRAHWGRATVSRLPTPLPGTAGSFGVQITTTVTTPARVGQPPIPVYIDEFGFVSGSAEIGLSVFGAPQPVPTETTERLLALLHRRAEAHKL
jgi:hypothetical protein